METTVSEQSRMLMAQKAFAIMESFWSLESALWEVFEREFYAFCEIKSEELEQQRKGANQETK